MNEQFVKETTFKGKWDKSETFRILVLFLFQRQGQSIETDELIDIAYRQNRLPRYQKKRNTVWKDKSGLWWKGKKRTLMFRTKEDIELLQKVGIIKKIGEKNLITNNLDLETFLK